MVDSLTNQYILCLFFDSRHYITLFLSSMKNMIQVSNPQSCKYSSVNLSLHCTILGILYQCLIFRLHNFSIMLSGKTLLASSAMLMSQPRGKDVIKMPPILVSLQRSVISVMLAKLDHPNFMNQVGFYLHSMLE